MNPYVQNLHDAIEDAKSAYQKRLDFFNTNNLNTDDFTVVIGCGKRIKLPLQNASNTLVSAHDVMRLANLDAKIDVHNKIMIDLLAKIDEHLRNYAIFSNHRAPHCFLLIDARNGVLLRFKVGFFFPDFMSEKLNILRLSQRMIEFDKKALSTILEKAQGLVVNEAMMSKEPGYNIETWVVTLTTSGNAHSFIIKAHSLEACLIFLAATQCSAVSITHHELNVSFTPKRIHSAQKEIFHEP